LDFQNKKKRNAREERQGWQNSPRAAAGSRVLFFSQFFITL
jgi:hypothetical protein